MPDSFPNKAALVTGASRGIGRAAIAVTLAGAAVTVNYQTRESEAGERCAEIERLGRRGGRRPRRCVPGR
jgi:NAD(P)-dependent dehydrogenase (short-subunit alcohol dehydrogenase family)